MAQAVVNPSELRLDSPRTPALQHRAAQPDGRHPRPALRPQPDLADKEQEKFTEEFEATLIVINRFIEATNAFVPFLLRKAERVEEYLQQR